ncbi:MAG: hypothetical protein QOG64_2702 [Acidimicrobiaceae bacterium]|nr:hypothetical protein [Acidimicrobiaceae bacterium]
MEMDTHGGWGRRRGRVLAAVAAAIASLLMVNGGQIGGQRAAAADTASSAGRPSVFLYHFNGGRVSAPGRALVALNAWEYAAIPQIKAENPSAIVLAYKDLSSTRSYACRGGVDDAQLPAGVGYCDADAHHPEWFLKDANGARLTYANPFYDGHWQMDVGNAAYQQAWVDNVQRDLLTHGFDGVMIDNALTACDNYHPGVCPAAYPNNASFQAAYRSMLGAVGNAFRPNGLLTFANINDSRLFPGLLRDWLSLLDGAQEEHFANWSSKTGSGYMWDWGPDGWKAMVDEVATAASMGKRLIATGGGVKTDPDAFTYDLASFMLATDGRSVFAFGDQTVWHPEYDWDLGTPLSAYYPLGANVYRRDFSAGTVIVNAAKSTSTTVPLGSTFLAADGSPLTSVTLGATRGAILRLAQGSTPAPPPAPPAPVPTPAPLPAPAPVDAGSTPVRAAGPPPAAASAAPQPPRFWMTAGDGSVAALGAGRFAGSLTGHHLNQPVVGMAGTPTGDGYWLVARDGGIFAFGDAAFSGSTGNIHLNQPIVGMASSPSGHGYWFVAADVGDLAFGDAAFYGSTGNMHLNQPIVGMAATPTGDGYWLVARDGGIFAFGDATFSGSTGNIHLNQPIVGMASSPSGHGYRFVAADGGVFAFGDAAFYGSGGATALGSRVAGMATSATGQGYWLVTADGRALAFGDATDAAVAGSTLTGQPVIAIAS